MMIESGKLTPNDSGEMSFVPFSTSPALTIISGSQAASGVPAIFQIANVDLSRITRVEAKLIVDQAPIGLYEDSDPAFTCTDSSSQYEAMIFIDVSNHPTVNNIIKLDQRDVILDYKISAGEEVLAEDLVTVRLTF